MSYCTSPFPSKSVVLLNRLRDARTVATVEAAWEAYAAHIRSGMRAPDAPLAAVYNNSTERHLADMFRQYVVRAHKYLT